MFVIIPVFGGFIPSLVWLFTFLKKDSHPEPRSLIIRTFFFGMLIAPLVVLLELLANYFVQLSWAVNFFDKTLLFFLLAAFIEEYIKYLVVRLTLVHNPEFNEPMDAMIYMIIAGLGFAAIENILVLFKMYPEGLLPTTGIWVLRFAGATLLHALASGIIGYFLAVAWFYHYHSKKIIAAGIAIATLFHLAFNLIVFSKHETSFYTSTGLVIMMLIVVIFFFASIKRKQLREIALSTENLIKAGKL